MPMHSAADLRRMEEKQMQKEMETPEEKYKRRMEKKLKKAGKKAEEEALLGYTNEANPFGDSNLSGGGRVG